MANIKEVAKMAGVSVTTVSRVLNNHPYVKEDKRKSVLDAIEKLDYIQNLNAVNLAKGKSYTVGVILPFINHPHFGDIVQGIASAALEHNYRFIMCQTDYKAEEELKFLQLLKMKQIDGVIICSKTSSWDEIEPFSEFGPIVACEDTRGAAISSVFIDHYGGFKLGMDHLISKGHRKIGYCIARGYSFNSRQRKKAYLDALGEIGASIHNDWMFDQCIFIEDGIRVVHELLNMKDRPSALLVACDQVAAGIVTEARKRGIRVPEDLAVIGFDNHPISKVLDITTIEHHSVSLGKNAFNLAFSLIADNNNKVEKVELPYQLIVRSTA
ncbi:LacI family transcriptional regulator [Bacillus sp. V3-13]|uniref:LacI family DNA-binding transcriptional regulator n=1 Tax=Bacillus sp. V3-13 TaxID=2053728 RepID=UPI000C757816|nr:LacI family DNA-binding transcriptional regulator [Bacillus sp. V3-13]PLR76888.1 LacI family transcriptional regulator [Bacillus sp. V3-13]